MKKILLLMIALLSLALLFSCGDEGGVKPVDTTDVGSQTEGTPDETTETNPGRPPIPVEVLNSYKYVTFSLPTVPFRDAIVDHMRKQASIEWVCSNDFGVNEKFNSWGIDLTFIKGQKYTGIPYADTKVSYDQWVEAIGPNKRYTCDSDQWKDVFGVQCVSSIMNSIQQFDPSVCGYSTHLTPGQKEFKGVILGDYTVTEDVKQTKMIIEANSPEVLAEAYAKLKKGDIIIRQDYINDASHLRVIATDPVITRNAAGKINMNRSTVTCVEQTNSFDKSRTDGVKTTWWMDHVYTFDQLRGTDYVPVTLEIYSKDPATCELPYIYLDKEILESQIQKNALGSTVKSNFPIRFVHLDIYKKSGEFVKREMAYDMASNYSVNLRKYSMTLTDGLESGEYTLVVTAGIAIDKAELGRFDFTFTKK